MMLIREGKQEALAVSHFRKLIKPWRRAFTEDNWATTADHLHELLQRAMIEEGANAAFIAFASFVFTSTSPTLPAR